MKFNWGHGLFITIAISIAGILTLVYLSSRIKVDLVTEEYYPKELVYQEQIEKQKNTRNLIEKVSVNLADLMVFQFPAISADPSDIAGEILFYRPSDRALDRSEIIKLDTFYRQYFIISEFQTGKYDIIIEWNCENIEYMQKEIVLKPK